MYRVVAIALLLACALDQWVYDGRLLFALKEILRHALVQIT
jgi:hypothetical protein